MTAVATKHRVDVAAVEHEAVLRRALERLLKIDDMRAAVQLSHAGRTQREIAETLHTTQPRVHRMLKAMELRGSDRETPEEVVLRATVKGTDRDTLVEALSRLTYTFTEHAPEPFDGSKPGTWNQVRSAYLSGLLTEPEYERVRAAVRPPNA